MNICVFGIDRSFGLNRIGGTDSFYRRLARQWVSRGHRVSFVNYQCETESQGTGWHGIASHEFKEFSAALAHLEARADVVIVNTLHRNDRLAFACFRRRWQAKKKFFIVYSLFREQPILRQMHFLESIVYPYQHGAWCMSPRLTRALRRWGGRADLVWPPVGPEYFCPPQTKPAGDRVRVTYIGRTEAGKGIDDVVAVLHQLQGDERFQLMVRGYHFPGDVRAAAMHEWLQAQPWLEYEHRPIQAWSPELERDLASALRKTDILLLPYRRLSSSIDTPLLLIEGMAASCCVLTRPFGDIPSVYGESPLLIPEGDFAARAVPLIRDAPRWIEAERARVFDQAGTLRFDEASVAEQALERMEAA